MTLLPQEGLTRLCLSYAPDALWQAFGKAHQVGDNTLNSGRKTG
jgi:hypothetical protein